MNHKKLKDQTVVFYRCKFKLNMNRLVSNIKRLLFTTKEFELGRWKINYCNNVITDKVKMANEDHCGVCITNTDVKNDIKTPTLYIKAEK